MDTALRRLVQQRGQGRCEYCRFPEQHAFFPFQIDHIIAEKHHGETSEPNLAWSCYYCNTYKGPNLAGWDMLTQEVVRLFHPRRDTWDEHFVWRGALLTSRSAIGRVTIDVLNINSPDALSVRRLLLACGESLA